MKRWSLLVATLLVAVSLHASPVSRSEAFVMAAAFLKQDNVTMVPTQFEHFYVFNGDRGFVILAADDCVMPVLGYSFDDPFNMDMAESTREWLQNYNEAVRTAVESEVGDTEEIRQAWLSLRNYGCLPVYNRKVVEPLVVTVWNQRNPYNMYCPQDSYTGCVATVMAQIMKYWEYPCKGTGQHSYFHGTYGQQSANFGATTYDWDNMPVMATNGSSDVVKRAVATLCYHCGVAVEMDYGPNFSGAFTSMVVDAMSTYFGYASTMSLESRDYYTDDQWIAMLKSELDAMRPMYYDGNHDSSGHAFICDGYDASNYFHINWGWGGSNNGYYAMGALNPGSNGSYNQNNHAIIGIQPSSYSVSAPTNLNAAVQQETQVYLSWSASAGAAYYKVYRDGVMIASRVDQLNYTDVASYGIHSYYVKAVNAAGERSANSNIVTVEVSFTAPAPVALEGEPQGDDLILTWDMPFGQVENLNYGVGSMGSSMGYNGTYDTYWGQRYPVSLLADLAGMTMTKVSAYLRQAGNYTLYVGKGNFYAVNEVLFQKNYTVSSEGWFNFTLDPSMPLDYTSDLWVVLSAPSSINYPAAYCTYSGPGLEDASFISTGLQNITSYSCQSDNISWMMKVVLTDKDFTYSVSRDGSVVATNLSERTFTDHGVASGVHAYQVRTALNGVDSDQTATLETELALVNVVSDNPSAGSVTGGGLAEVGSSVTVNAHPAQGYLFRHWLEDGVVVGTDATYSFIVTGDRRLTACFSGWGLEEESLQMTVRKIEVYTLTGVLLETRVPEGDRLNLRLEGCSNGVYLLRLTTDEGVMVKKVVLGF